MKICVICGNEFIPKRKSSKCCYAIACIRKMLNRRGKEFKDRMRREKRCRDCGSLFESSRKRKGLCCDLCLDKNAKRRAEKAKEKSFYMYENAKVRSRQQGIPFNIKKSDIVFTEFCPILGIKMEKGKHGVIHDGSPTLDKIIPGIGYVVGNIQVISRRANMLKNNATIDELILLGKWAEEYKCRRE